jgi:hypothetical protein
MLAPRECELRYFSGLKIEECTQQERAAFLQRGLFTKIRDRIFPSASAIFNEKNMYHPEVFGFRDKYMNAFFLCNKYYEDILPLLQKEFVFPVHSDAGMQKRNEELMAEMLQRPSASIHLRRGDYLTEPQNFALFGNISTQEYYDAAIRYVLEREPDAHFYIFSNDVEYARENYSDTSRYTVVTGNDGKDSLLDMQLMSRCRFNICANSTFSFWGARLNSRPDRVCIRTFRMRNNQDAVAGELHDFWTDWVFIDEKGMER